jgi:hypothetical protein
MSRKTRTGIQIGVLSLALSGLAQAAPYTVINNATGARYECGAGSGGGATSPACVSGLTDLCYSRTSQTRDQCYQLSVKSCPGTGADFVSCVDETEKYCYSNTSGNHNTCFAQALQVCRGNGFEIRALMDGVKQKAALDTLRTGAPVPKE